MLGYRYQILPLGHYRPHDPLYHSCACPLAAVNANTHTYTYTYTCTDTCTTTSMAATAAACLDSADDVRVMAAAASLLGDLLCLTLARGAAHGGGEAAAASDDYLLRPYEAWAAAGAVYSAALGSDALESVRSILAFFDDGAGGAGRASGSSSGSGSRADPSLWLAGCQHGHRSRGVLDGVFRLLLGVVAFESAAVRAPPTPAPSPGVAASVDTRLTGKLAFTRSPTAAQFAGVACRLLQSGGRGELSPTGTLALLQFVSTFAKLASGWPFNSGAVDVRDAGPDGGLLPVHRDASVLALVQREGLIGLVALCTLPQHLEMCYRWLMITPPAQADTASLAAVGAALGMCGAFQAPGTRADTDGSDGTDGRATLDGAGLSSVISPLLCHLGVLTSSVLSLVGAVQLYPTALADIGVGKVCGCWVLRCNHIRSLLPLLYPCPLTIILSTKTAHFPLKCRWVPRKCRHLC